MKSDRLQSEIRKRSDRDQIEVRRRDQTSFVEPMQCTIRPIKQEVRLEKKKTNKQTKKPE